MPEEVATMYNALPKFAQREADDYIAFLAARSQPKSPKWTDIEKFVGCISDEDAEIMLKAVEECRKIEGPNEW